MLKIKDEGSLGVWFSLGWIFPYWWLCAFGTFVHFSEPWAPHAGSLASGPLSLLLLTLGPWCTLFVPGNHVKKEQTLYNTHERVCLYQGTMWNRNYRMRDQLLWGVILIIKSDFLNEWSNLIIWSSICSITFNHGQSPKKKRANVMAHIHRITEFTIHFRCDRYCKKQAIKSKVEIWTKDSYCKKLYTTFIPNCSSAGKGTRAVSYECVRSSH